MLGVPGSPGVLGWILLVLGLVGAAAAAGFFLARRRPGLAGSALVVCAATTLGVGPFLVWRIIEDMRYTTGLDAYERNAAGPIQAFLPGYLLDPVRRIVPRDATYATAVGDKVPHSAAHVGFPPLALTTLFPRLSVDDPRKADFVIAWGTDPRRLAPVSRVVVARGALGPLPSVVVATVRR
jgi:hypothetical protein